MAEPEQRIKIIYDWADADASAEARKNLNFSATFGSEGRGGSSGGGFSSAGGSGGSGANMDRLNQAVIRETLARERVAAALEANGGRIGSGSIDYPSFRSPGTVTGFRGQGARGGEGPLGSGDPQDRYAGDDTRFQKVQQRREREDDKLLHKFERMGAAIEGERDRNETRYSRSSDAAAFSAFKQSEREDIARSERGSSALSNFAAQEREARGNATRANAFGHANRYSQEWDDRTETAQAAAASEQAAAESDPEFVRANLAGAQAQTKADAAKPGGGGRGSSGRLFQRFIALEGLRTAGAIVGAQLQYQQAEVTAGNNQTALANAALQRAQSIASGAPFGLGEIALGAANGISAAWNGLTGGSFTGNLTYANSQIAQAANAEQLINMRSQRFDRTMTMNHAARLANTPLGLSRSLQQADDERDVALVQNQKFATDSANAVEQQFALRKSLGDTINPQDRTAALDKVSAARATMDAAAEAKRRGDRDTASNISEGITDRFNASGASIREQTRIGARPANEYSLEGMFSIEGRRSALVRGQRVETSRQQESQNAEEDITRREHPENLSGLQNRNRAQREGLAASQLQERGEFDVQSGLELKRTLAQLNANIAVSQGAINRDPLGTIRAQGFGRVAQATFIPDPATRQRAIDASDTQQTAEENDYRGNRRLTGMQIATREKVTGLQAQAFGAGASQYAAQARIADIVGSTEVSAQSRTFHDASDEAKQQADSIRRSGINELKTVQAQFYQSLSVGQGNANSFNMSPSGGTDAVELLRSIDEGIHDLKSNMGNLVATD